MAKFFQTYKDGKPLFQDNESYNFAEICRLSNVSRTTLYRLKINGKLKPLKGNPNKFKGLDVHRALSGQRSGI